MRIAAVLALSLLVPVASFFSGCSFFDSWLGNSVMEGSVQIVQGFTVIASGGAFDFGSVPVASRSTPVRFEIQNAGTVPFSLSFDDAVQETDTADFTLTPPTTTIVPAGGSVPFEVAFTPTFIASIASTITVRTSQGTSSFAVSGTGTGAGSFGLAYDGAAGWMDVANGGTVAFAPLLSSESETVQFQITNGGTDALSILAGPVFLTSNEPGDFSLTASPVSPVASASTTTFDITYYGRKDNQSSSEVVQLLTSDQGNQVFDVTVQGTTRDF